MAPLEAAWYAGVNLTSMEKVFMMSLYKLLIKEFPLSETATCGAPYLEIHCMKAAQHSAEVAAFIGYASTHLLVLSRQVRRNLWPWEGGSGPTTSR